MCDGEVTDGPLSYSRFSQTNKIDSNDIIANFVFPYICNFLLYFSNMMIAVGVRAEHFKVADFIGLVPFQWHRQNKIGSNGILVLQRVCENLYYFIKIYSLIHHAFEGSIFFQFYLGCLENNYKA